MRCTVGQLELSAKPTGMESIILPFLLLSGHLRAAHFVTLRRRNGVYFEIEQRMSRCTSDDEPLMRSFCFLDVITTVVAGPGIDPPHPVREGLVGGARNAAD